MGGDTATKATALITCLITIIGFITISSSINIQNAETHPTIILTPTVTSTPSLTLLGAGSRWAAKGGNNALYVNWIDYNSAHPGDPTDFNPPPNGVKLVSAVISALNDNNLVVDRASRIPRDLSKYSVVVIDCYWVCNPSESQHLSNYIHNGGGLVLISGTPPYFVVSDRTMHPQQNDLSSIESWLGASYYSNTGGQALVSVNNPFGTALLINQTVLTETGSPASVSQLQPGANPVAVWADGNVFAYTYEYGSGRVYYQASHDFTL